MKTALIPSKLLLEDYFHFCSLYVFLLYAFPYGNEIYLREKPDVSNSDNFLNDSVIKMNELPFFFTFLYKSGNQLRI